MFSLAQIFFLGQGVLKNALSNFAININPLWCTPRGPSWKPFSSWLSETHTLKSFMQTFPIYLFSNMASHDSYNPYFSLHKQLRDALGHWQSNTRLSLKCSAWRGLMNFASKKIFKKKCRSEKVQFGGFWCLSISDIWLCKVLIKVSGVCGIIFPRS